LDFHFARFYIAKYDFGSAVPLLKKKHELHLYQYEIISSTC